MLGLKQRVGITACLVLSALVLKASGFAYAETMSSTNFRVQTDIISQGGGSATSGSYWGDDTIGDTATGEGMSSANYIGCSGYECFGGADYITFSVRAGLTEGTATAGTPVDLGTLETSSVTTSDGTTVNSIFIDIDSNAPGGNAVSVRATNSGLQHESGSPTIASANTTITAGLSAFGLCVFSTTEDSYSPSTLDPASPYDGTCTKTTGHQVGGPTGTAANILVTSEEISNGQAEILVKASVSGTVTSGNYEETLTFIATGTY